MNKEELLQAGILRIRAWLDHNPTIPDITIEQAPKNDWRFQHTCAYYRNHTIHICVEQCAAPGTAGRSWSWPGYSVDRTPYGVLAHELGHHVDRNLGTEKHAYSFNICTTVRRVTKELPLTGYCPNDAEWWAEMFRLYVTNSDFLWKIRPRTYNVLRGLGLEPVDETPWEERLAMNGAPPRTLAAARAKVAQTARGARRHA